MSNTLVRVLVTNFLFLLLSVNLVGARSKPVTDQSSFLQTTADVTPAYCIAEHNVGKIKLAVTNHGELDIGFVLSGYLDCFTGQGVSHCEYPAGSNTISLWSAAYWVGAIVGDDTLVSVGADGWVQANEFHPDVDGYGQMIKRSTLDPSSEFFWDAVSEQDYVGVFTDTFTSGVSGLTLDEIDNRPHIPLNIEITQKSYAWSYSYADDFILFDCAVKNLGTELLKDTYIGIYVDADVLEAASYMGWDDDLAGFLKESQVYGNGCSWNEQLDIAWIADNGSGPDFLPNLTGFRILGNLFDQSLKSFNWYFSNGTGVLDFGPQAKSTVRDLGTGGSGTPAGDRNKYAFLSNGEIDYNQVSTASIQPDDPTWVYPAPALARECSNGMDTKYLLSFGPFDIAPGQTIPFVYTMVGGENFHKDEDNYERNLSHNYNPELYMENVDFSDLILNARWADWIYDNPGIDTDGDGYFGEFQLCGSDTIWVSGDGVPDFTAATPPPSPTMRIEAGQDQFVIRWNGLKSETTPDRFSRKPDFEGYHVYLATGESKALRSEFALVGSLDRVDYITHRWDETSQTWVVLTNPKTIAELRCEFGISCEDKSFSPSNYDQDNPLVIESPSAMTIYFEPYGSNLKDRIIRSYPNQPYPSNLNPALATPDELTEAGDLKYFEYEMVIDNLFGEACYQVAVVAYDFGSAITNLPMLIGNIHEASTDACLADVQSVAIDIQPGSCPNRLGVIIINGPIDEEEPPASYKLTPTQETISIAILGSEVLDVNTIDPATLIFEREDAISWSIVDNSTLADLTSNGCACNAEGADGFDDLNVIFANPKAVILPEGVKQGDQWPLLLSGTLNDGTLIFGSDCVVLTSAREEPLTVPDRAEATLLGSYPNPFNPTTEIHFSLTQAQHVKLEVFNVLGQQMELLLDRRVEAGEHSVPWNGNGFASGLYFYRFETTGKIQSGKMLLIK